MKKIKKILVMFLVAALTATLFGTAVFADPELNWEDFESMFEERDGEFTDLGDTGLEMWVPAEFKEADLSGAENADNVIVLYTTEDEEATVQFAYADPSMKSVAEIKEELEKDEAVSDIDTAYINGRSALSCSVGDEDFGLVYQEVPGGLILELGIEPMSDMDFARTCQLMMVSIREKASSGKDRLKMDAFGSDVKAPEANWSELEDQFEKVEKQLVVFDAVSAQMFIPADYEEAEAEDKDAEMGILGCYTSKDGKIRITAELLDAGGKDLTAFEKELQDEGVGSEITEAYLNGIPAVTYEDKENDCGVIVCETESGLFFCLTFEPISDTATQAAAQLAVASLMSGKDTLAEADFSKEIDAEVIAWSDAQDYIKDTKGDFVTLDEVAAKIWIPASLKAGEITEKDVEAGVIAYYTTEDGTGFLTVSYVDAEGRTLEEIAASLEETDGIIDLEYVVLNGIGVISYEVEDEDCGSIDTVTENGCYLTFFFSSLTDDDSRQLASLIGASIMPEDNAG